MSKNVERLRQNLRYLPVVGPPGLSCWRSHREVRTSSKLSYIHQNSHKNHSILNYKYEHWQYDIIAVKEKD